MVLEFEEIIVIRILDTNQNNKLWKTEGIRNATIEIPREEEEGEEEEEEEEKKRISNEFCHNLVNNLRKHDRRSSYLYSITRLPVT